MSFSSLRIRVRACFGFRLLAIGILLWPVAAFAQPSGDIITVNVDQAKLLRLPTRVATIVVGNPLIADVTLQTGGGGGLPGQGSGPPQIYSRCAARRDPACPAASSRRPRRTASAGLSPALSP